MLPTTTPVENPTMYWLELTYEVVTNGQRVCGIVTDNDGRNCKFTLDAVTTAMAKALSVGNCVKASVLTIRVN
jgi:hypothetical protein